MTGAEILFEGVSKWFPAARGGRLVAVDRIDLAVARGERLALLGQTGCGKSTLFTLIAGLARPSEGRVLVEGRDPFRAFAALRGRIAIVFQNDRLLPWRRALDNAALGLELMDVPPAERHARAGHWLARLGLSGHERDYPHALSGGMRQRVAIARAFATDAPILLCDEPFSALDELTAQRLRAEFLSLVTETGRTAIFITHSISEALEVGQRLVVLRRPARIACDLRLDAITAGPDAIRAQIRAALAA